MMAMELYFKVSSVLLQFINEHHLQEILAFRIGLYKLLSVDEHRNWEEAGTYLINLSEEIFDALGQYENTLSDRALDRVVEYIDTHLEGDLSLTNLAAVGGFNASYLSRLFKQVQNETISDYVLKKRMEAAKVLLQESQEKNAKYQYENRLSVFDFLFPGISKLYGGIPSGIQGDGKVNK